MKVFRIIREAIVWGSLLTPLRILNFLMIRCSYLYSRLRGKVLHVGYPVSIAIEPTNFCNLRCPECPTGRNSLTRNKGKINPDFFRTLIDQLAPHCLYLNLSFQGEPLMINNLPELVVYARSKKMYVSFSTNAHFLTENTARDLVQSRLNRIIISMDGMVQETYEKYRIGGDIEKLKAGIANLVQAKKMAGSQAPLTVLQFIVFKHNYHEINAIKAFAREIGIDKTEFKTAQVENPDHAAKLVPDDPRYARYTLSDSSPKIKSKLPDRCYRTWSSPVITWDGKLLPCCFDKDAEFAMGDLNKTPFREIWKGDLFQQFRSKVFQSRKSFTMCCNCTEGLKR